MSTLDAIFQAYFQVVDFSYFIDLLVGVLILEFFYTIVSNWDML